MFDIKGPDNLSLAIEDIKLMNPKELTLGGYTLTVRASDTNANFSGEKTLQFNINKYELSSNNIGEGFVGEYEYTGSHPSFEDLKIYVSDVELIINTDYEIVINEVTTVNPGMNKELTIRGIGDFYSGEFVVTYKITSVAGEINPNNIELVIEDETIVYTKEAKEPRLSFLLNGVPVEDQYSIRYFTDEIHETEVDAAIDAGTYYITVEFGGLIFENTVELLGQFVIEKEEVTISAKDLVTTYGDTVTDLNSQWEAIEGQVYGNDIEAVVTTTAGEKADVGEYELNIEVSEGADKNYIVTLRKGKHSVVKKDIDLTVAVDHQTIMEGGTLDNITYTMVSNGFVEGENTSSLVFTPGTILYQGSGDTVYPTSEVAPTDSGTYEIIMDRETTNVTSQNYNVTNLTINPGQLIISKANLLSLSAETDFAFISLKRVGLKYQYQYTKDHTEYDPNNIPVVKVTVRGLTINKALAHFGNINIDNINVYNQNNKLMAKSTYSSPFYKVGTGWRIELLSGDTVIDEVKFSLYGDYNGDGNVNVTDVNLLYNAFKNNKFDKNNLPLKYACDINSDGNVNTTDVNLMYSKQKNGTL